jgi:hypothetical protein
VLREDAVSGKVAPWNFTLPKWKPTRPGKAAVAQ